MPRPRSARKAKEPPGARKFSAALSDQAYYAIRDKILVGDLPLGASLSRPALAAELGMSVLPISQALQRLESEGLVESRPRIGTRVKVPTPQDVRGHYVVREALECHSARLFAEKASQDEKDEIRRLAAELDATWSRLDEGEGDRKRLWMLVHRMHGRFHMRIAECTGFPALCQAIERSQILIFNWFYDAAFKDWQLPSNWHSQLAEALSRGIPDEAYGAMRQHLRAGLDSIVRRLESHLGWAPPLLDAGAELTGQGWRVR